MEENALKVKFWGVRGSYPVADKDFLKYGGNTSCVEITAGNNHIILDCGTGIIPLGNKMASSGISNAIILLSHVHQDHIQGLNFFKPINMESSSLSIYSDSHNNIPLKQTLSDLLYGKSFPLNFENIPAELNITDITDNEVIIIDNNDKPVLKNFSEINDIKPQEDEVIISTLKSNSHPNYGVMCYKISYKNKSIVYATDTEYNCETSKRFELFAKDADLLIHDSQYTKEDYWANESPKQGYGHSTFDMAYETAVEANVKQLAFFHFDPSYNDEKLTNIEKFFKNINENYFLAKEGMEICI